MTNSSFVLSQTYINSVLIPDYEMIAFQTEDGGNAVNFYKFSWAGGVSSYSFGLYQFDIKKNTNAQLFLTSIGFTTQEISELSHNGGLSTATLTALDNKLSHAMNTAKGQIAYQTLNNEWSAYLVDKLQSLLNYLGQTNPAIAQQICHDTSLQLRLLDVVNQYGSFENHNLHITSWLSGRPVYQEGIEYQLIPSQPLTGAEISNFLLGDHYNATKNQNGQYANLAGSKTRLTSLNHILSSMTSITTSYGNFVLPTVSKMIIPNMGGLASLQG